MWNIITWSLSYETRFHTLAGAGAVPSLPRVDLHCSCSVIYAPHAAVTDSNSVEISDRVPNIKPGANLRAPGVIYCERATTRRDDGSIRPAHAANPNAIIDSTSVSLTSYEISNSDLVPNPNPREGGRGKPTSSGGG